MVGTLAFNHIPQDHAQIETDRDNSASTRMGLSRSGKSFLKRVLDIAIAGSALLFVAPLMLMIALIIKLQDGGPVLFAHKRIGKRNQAFSCLKFRSMVTNAQARLDAYLEDDPEARREWELSQKLHRDPRITPIGLFLRKSSLDELPQLINILRGDMSLVGPRPIVQAEVPRYGDKIGVYCSTRPGLTGLWQVSGRSDTSYDFRVNLDVSYVNDWNLGKDFLIIAKTIPVVFAARGAR